MSVFLFKMYKGGIFLKNHANILLRNDCLVRSKYINEGCKLLIFGFSKNCFHQSQLLECSTTKQLPLPLNLKDIASSEKVKFSPQRSRDINGSFLSCSSSPTLNSEQHENVKSIEESIECYDCSGAVNLSSAMQTNVPFPFVSKGKPIHLNMPGGQWRQKEKYVSEDLNNAHHKNTSQLNSGSGTTCTLGSKRGTKNFYFCLPPRELNFLNCSFSPFSNLQTSQWRTFCSVKDKIEVANLEVEKKAPALSKKAKLKAAIRDYGAVILVFHVGISLVSLGCFYVLVVSGVDVSYIFKHFGMDDGAGAAGTAAHFVIAYALHKSLAPVRITVTLTAAPFIVKKLRKIGLLKTPGSKPLST